MILLEIIIPQYQQQQNEIYCEHLRLQEFIGVIIKLYVHVY